MKPCGHLSHYLDGRLERAGRDYFEAHLHICADCQKVVNTWCGTKSGLRKEALERIEYLTPTIEEAARFVERAKSDRVPQRLWDLRTIYPMGVTAFVSFALAGVLSLLIAYRTPSEQTKTLVSHPIAGVINSFVQYEATMDGNMIGRLGDDRFGLRPSSQLSVVSTGGRVTRLKLEKGSAAFSVASRLKGKEFIVEVGNYNVVVIGTKFSVDRSEEEGVRVSVLEGKVEIKGEDGRVWRISAGETLLVAHSGEAHRSPATEDETAMVAWILGEVDPDRVMNLTEGAETPDEASQGAVAMVFDTPPEEKVSPILAVAGTNPDSREEALLIKGDKVSSGADSEPQSVSSPGKKATESDILKNAKESNPSPAKDNELTLADDVQGVELWRQWVLAGRLTDAEKALDIHLKSHSIDTDAMSLLADCRRKSGKYLEALKMYKDLMDIAGPQEADRARFKAGVLMQEQLNDHFGAAMIFEEYIASNTGTPLLKAKATVRLARSLIVLGEKIRARNLLNQVIQNHGGTSSAIQAREILDRLN